MLTEQEVISTLNDIICKVTETAFGTKIMPVVEEFKDGIDRPSLKLSLESFEIAQEDSFSRKKSYNFILYYFAGNKVREEFVILRESLTEALWQGFMMKDIWVEVEDISFTQSLKESVLICDFSFDIYENVIDDDIINAETMETLDIRKV